MRNKVNMFIRSNDLVKKDGISNYVVGKNAADQYSSVKSAIDAAGLVATDEHPLSVIVTPGLYIETEVINLPDNVLVVGVPGFRTYTTGSNSSPIISGSFSKTSSKSSLMQGLIIDAPGSSNCLHVNTPMDWDYTNLTMRDMTFLGNEASAEVIKIESGYVIIEDSSVMRRGVDGLVANISGETFVQFYNSVIGCDDDQHSIHSSGSTISLNYCSLRGYLSADEAGYLGIYNSCIVSERAAGLATIQLAADSSCAVENVVINNDGGGGRFSADGDFYIWGPIYREDEKISTAKDDIPSISGTGIYNDCFINKFNADPCTIIKSSSGGVTLARQNRICIINKSSAAITTASLPNASICYLGQEHIILDGKGDANTYNIYVTGSGATINGLVGSTIRAPYGRLHVIYNGTQWNIANSMTGTVVI